MVANRVVSHLMEALKLQNAGGLTGSPTDQPVDWQPTCHGVPHLDQIKGTQCVHKQGCLSWRFI